MDPVVCRIHLLPCETLSQIFGYLDKKSLVACLTVSDHFFHRTAPLLYYRISQVDLSFTCTSERQYYKFIKNIELSSHFVQLTEYQSVYLNFLELASSCCFNLRRISFPRLDTSKSCSQSELNRLSRRIMKLVFEGFLNMPSLDELSLGCVDVILLHKYLMKQDCLNQWGKIKAVNLSEVIMERNSLGRLKRILSVVSNIKLISLGFESGMPMSIDPVEWGHIMDFNYCHTLQLNHIFFSEEPSTFANFTSTSCSIPSISINTSELSSTDLFFMLSSFPNLVGLTLHGLLLTAPDFLSAVMSKLRTFRFESVYMDTSVLGRILSTAENLEYLSLPNLNEVNAAVFAGLSSLKTFALNGKLNGGFKHLVNCLSTAPSLQELEFSNVNTWEESYQLIFGINVQRITITVHSAFTSTFLERFLSRQVPAVIHTNPNILLPNFVIKYHAEGVDFNPVQWKRKFPSHASSFRFVSTDPYAKWSIVVVAVPVYQYHQLLSETSIEFPKLPAYHTAPIEVSSLSSKLSISCIVTL
ncbi:hypothetical protein BKA69DRAFT_1061037 [Paraphysoderma sedebokerense]|nr:hypothetical protein BKA69DRAFT_1061037 [Paraphysoderma sedebokerense]